MGRPSEETWNGETDGEKERERERKARGEKRARGKETERKRKSAARWEKMLCVTRRSHAGKRVHAAKRVRTRGMRITRAEYGRLFLELSFLCTGARRLLSLLLRVRERDTIYNTVRSRSHTPRAPLRYTRHIRSPHRAIFPPKLKQ